ncbi:chemotaxis-specific protein-glutamate methyltransferase CheB [Massilia sp. CCM 8734]|uniref:chemotaxis-specific protein-glutamate methyltransferase CheB n=1 Tax=Massilia sp. CCM 8734 TaxID=2609283 RepID=UPI00142261E5|nr:chemotaxis-specific protein-glutamate methyltransferase CheB [Massilia sp. CCM 8734]
MRVAIASAVAGDAEAIARALEFAPRHTLSWRAASVDDACRLCAADPPDVLLMDLFAPPCGAAEATRRIMASTPCAILLLATNVGTYASEVFEAMGHGALDAVDMPRPGAPASRVNAAAFLLKLDEINSRLGERPPGDVLRSEVPMRKAQAANTLVAIGASAGGPAAIRTVLAALPRDFRAAVVIVQHLDQRFAPGMVEWLGEYSALPVRMAREGDVPEAGVALLAGTNDHLVFKGSARLGYSPLPAECVYRPSVDVFFQSIMRLWQGRGIGVLLTGMGRDGALGLKGLRDKGYYTIAQDLASSAVYGMPKAAIGLGAAIETLAAVRIAARLVELVDDDRQWRK